MRYIISFTVFLLAFGSVYQGFANTEELQDILDGGSADEGFIDAPDPLRDVLDGGSADQGFPDAPDPLRDVLDGGSADDGFLDASKRCSYDVDGKKVKSIGDALDDCLGDSQLVNSSGDTDIAGAGKNFVTSWTRALAQLLGLLAVGAIVYGGLLMTLSGGDDEKIKKGKDVVKWAILGFLGVITAGALVRILIEFIFAVGS